MREGSFLRQGWVALAVALAACALRLYFNLVVHPPGDFIDSDMWVYDLRARNLLGGTLGIWDTFTPVGYPALLAFLYWIGGGEMAWVAVAQAILGGATAGLIHLVGFRLTSSWALALASSLLTAAHLPLVLYGGYLLSEVPFAFFVVLTVWLCLQAMDRPGAWRCLLAGLSFGAAAAIRPNLVLALPLLAIWAWRWRGGVREAAGFVGWTAAGILPLLLLVSFHNTRIAGRPVGLATNGGLNFYLAFAEVRGVEYRGDGVHRIVPIPNLVRYEKMETVAEPFWDEGAFYRRGVALVLREPGRLLRSLQGWVEGAGLGKQDFWPGWKGRRTLLVTYSRAFFFVGILPAALALLIRRKRDEEWLLWSFAGSAFLAMALFLGDPRMRVPFDPLLILLSVMALDRGLALVRRRRAAG